MLFLNLYVGGIIIKADKSKTQTPLGWNDDEALYNASVCPYRISQEGD